MKRSAIFFQKMLPVAIALGTSWAARGQIGHEYGAAWAGAIGVLAVIVLSGRRDWYARLPVIAALGAIGWGISGIISYGMVVGYGHSGNYLNVSYGLMCLVLVGGLYGFLGGGITGLALESSSGNKPDWAILFTQLFVGGYLCWGFFIYQLEWLMTPPRSELWAGCLGAAFALGWYLYRNGYRNALRTAFFSALGAGFGFGAGNFLQRMGQASGIPFNWWNVMEYSIGFFGGLGMAYGVFSGGNWPGAGTNSANGVNASEGTDGKNSHTASNKAGWIFLVILLPVINLIEGVNTKTMTGLGEHLHFADPASFASSWQGTSWILSIMCMFLIGWIGYRFTYRSGLQKNTALTLTLIYLAWYILISNIIGATWLTAKFSSQHLYWVNLVVLFFLFRSNKDIGIQTASFVPYRSILLKWWVFAILCILFLSYIAVTCSPASPHAQLRF